MVAEKPAAVVSQHTSRKLRLQKIKRPYGGGHYQAIVDSRGKPHAYLNAAIPSDRAGNPIAPLARAICEAGCSHAYAHLMGAKTCQCRECRDDATAEAALRVQEEYGVNLGWRSPDLEDRHDYLTMGDIRGMNAGGGR